MGDPADLPKIKPKDELKFYDPLLSWNIALYTFFQKLTGLAIFDHMLNTQSEPLFTPGIFLFLLMITCIYDHFSIRKVLASNRRDRCSLDILDALVNW